MAREAPLSLILFLLLLVAMFASFALAPFGRSVPRAALLGVGGVMVVVAAGGMAASVPLPFGIAGRPAVLGVDLVSFAFMPAAAIAAGAAAMRVDAASLGRQAAGLGGVLLALCGRDPGLLELGVAAAILASGRPVLAVLAALLLAGHATWMVIAVALWLTAQGEVLAVLGGFVLVRVLFELDDPAVGFVWGLVVVVGGLVGALSGGWRALTGATLDTVLAGLARVGGFVGVVGFGLALGARAADLPALASVSLGAGLLMVLGVAIGGALAACAAEAVIEQAGSRRLAALGGLKAPMRWTLAGLAGGVGSMVGVPLLAGFAPLWLTAEILLAAQRFGGLATPIGLAGGLAALGLAIGLGWAASVRLLLIVFGGRPRTPRGAAANEARRPVLRTMGVLGGLAAGASLVPGLWLRWWDPLVVGLTGSAIGSRAGWGGVQALTHGAVYAPFVLGGLVAVACGVPMWMLRRAGRLGEAAPAWAGGAAPPPEWLPFGEPLAQANGPGLARPVLAALGIEARRLPGEGPGPAGSGVPGSRLALRAGLLVWRRAVRAAGSLDETMLRFAPALLVSAVVLALAGVLVAARG